MEENTDQFLSEGNVSDAVFGTSSDAIIAGLHQGVLSAQSTVDAQEEGTGNDKNQIVNEQDQHEITNAPEDIDFTPSSMEKAAPVSAEYIPPISKSEAEDILSEDDHLDEAGDSEDGVASQNLEKDKLN